ncbi:MAG TPA: CocE/NonD family hydrolase [Ktedonobacterales bacterium]
MSLTGRVVTWLMKLPPAETPHVTITRDVAVPMPDGVTLLADHYMPQTDHPCPTILVRSPYGRRGFFGATTVLPYAERGYQVFVQSCRGTAGSGGEFAFARNERGDGLATIEWIKRQDWYSGQLAMVGPSYLGFAQWAVAADAGADLQALVLCVTTSDFHHFRSQGGSLTLENMLGWSTMMTEQAATGLQLGLSSILAMRRRGRNLETAYRSLPLDQADRVAINKPSAIYQEWFAHPTDDDYWRPIIFSDRAGEVTAPIALQAGWFDLFLDWQLQDYQRLRDAGRRPSLLIGPWFHGQMGSFPDMTRDGLSFLDARLKDKAASWRAHPVRLYVMGANAWREFEDWPPLAQSLRWSLRPNGALTTTPPDDTDTTEPDRYRYDPADPTPAVGGNSLGAPERMGQHDNRALEARPDVLVYTSAPLETDLEVIGPVTADLYVASSLDYTDYFARLCVVEESGKSLNLCDGILRLTPNDSAPDSDGVRHIQVALWPTAYHFRPGQRIRVQVSSGAHPRFARNPGTGEPDATATKLLIADQVVYHDAARPSAFILPVLA